MVEGVHPGPTMHFLPGVPGVPLSLVSNSGTGLGSSNTAAHRFELQQMQGSKLGATDLLPDHTLNHFDKQGSRLQGWPHLQLDKLEPFLHGGKQHDPFQLHRHIPWEPSQIQNHKREQQIQDLGYLRLEPIQQDFTEPHTHFEHKCSWPVVVTPLAAGFIQPPATTTTDKLAAPAPPTKDLPKDRIRWTPELHSHFMQCIESLGGLSCCTPKAILKLMRAKRHHFNLKLNIYHIKSHLQKCRLNCKEEQQDKAIAVNVSAASKSCPPARVNSEAAQSLSHKTQTLYIPPNSSTPPQLIGDQDQDQVHSCGLAGPSDGRESDAALSIDSGKCNSSSLYKPDAETCSGSDMLPKPSLAIQEVLRAQASLQRQIQQALKTQHELQRSLKHHLSNLSVLLAAEGLDPTIQ